MATFGLIMVIFALARSGRSASAPASVPAFTVAELAGGALALTAIRILYPG